MSEWMIFLIVLVGMLAVYGLVELWFRWSFRRDARAMMEMRNLGGHRPPRPLPPRPQQDGET